MLFVLFVKTETQRDIFN